MRAAKRRKLMRLVLDGYGVSDARNEHNAMAEAAKKKAAPLLMDEWQEGKHGAGKKRRVGKLDGARIYSTFLLQFQRAPKQVAWSVAIPKGKPGRRNSDTCSSTVRIVCLCTFYVGEFCNALFNYRDSY